MLVPADYFRRLAGRPGAEAYSLDDVPKEIGQQLDEGLDATLNRPKRR